LAVFICFILISYLIGSIPTSYLVGKGIGRIDLRRHGSGNLGATNAFRVLGWKIGVFVLCCDIIKGALPVIFLPKLATEAANPGIALHNMALIIGLAAILGHVFTVFMRFKGGKGVATSMGVFLALVPYPLLIALGISLIIIGATRYVSAGSLVGAIVLPILVYIFHPDRISLVVFTALVGILVIVRHRSNIIRLIKGKENKLFT